MPKLFNASFGIFVMALALTVALNSEARGQAIRYPNVSKDRIVFVYAGDLWLAPRSGGLATPLTSDPGNKSYPRFSPDGRQIAFTGNYNGVYTVPLTGGQPKRITHHPGATTFCSWTPDGRLLFMTDAFAPVFDADGQARVRQLFTVSASGGLPSKLPVPYGADGAISADGQWLAYTFYAEGATEARKHYFGGYAPDIWLFNLKSLQAKKITNWKGTDSRPMWHGDTVYYLSDGGPEGRLNIWSYDTRTARRQQITKFKEFDVKWPSMGPGPNDQGEIVLVSGADLYLLDLKTRQLHRVEVSVPRDRLDTLPKAVDASKSITNWNLSPDGRQALLEARGDIWTVSVGKGTPLNLTKTSGAAERDPAWSPDGKRIACFSDATGEYQLCILSADGQEAAKAVTRLQPALRYRPVWSPDSQRIAFHDSTGTIYLHNVLSGETKTIDRDPLVRQPQITWSPDSRWLAYARGAAGSPRNTAIWLYDIQNGHSHQVTGGAYNDTWPAFDSTGNYLYFVSARGFTSPKFDVVDYNNTVYTSNEWLLVVPLRSDIRAPWAPTKPDTNALTRGIDLKNFEHRAFIALSDSGKYGGLAAAVDGKLLFSFTTPDGASSVKVLNPKESRQAKAVLSAVGGFKVSADGNKLLVRQDRFAVLDAAPDQKADKQIDLGVMTVEVDPKAEGRQIFDDAWRLYRDYFYDPKMRGVDWQATRVKYSKLLDARGRREDVYEVIRDMLGELGSSHVFVWQANQDQLPPEDTGMLGVDFALENGAYRIARIFDGASFDPAARNSLTRPGVNVKEGEYLLAVNGSPLDVTQDPWSAFKGLAGRSAKLTISSKPVIDQEAREVAVGFPGSENSLRNRSWVEANRAYVDRLSNGRIGYIYLATTEVYGSSEFSRQLSGQLDKEALIVDGRWNEGGHLPIHMIDVLSRTFNSLSLDLRRVAGPNRTPDYMLAGPKALLTNGVAYSGGDYLAYLFKQRRVGKIIGTRTMGGMVGAGGIQLTFVDGGSALVPHVGFLDDQGNWTVEGYGVQPDVEVIDNPALMTRGGDPQLDAAIRYLLANTKRKRTASK